MAKDNSYTGKDIIALSDRDFVRLRTQIYFGNMHPTTYCIPILTADTLQFKEVEFIPAVYKAVGEIIDNCLDEFEQISIKNKTLSIKAIPSTGSYVISDNGRGIPIDKHETGKYTPEVAVGSLKAGRNFTDDKEVGVIGQNGVGSACTNYCSTEFNLIINRDGKHYKQTWTNGAEHVSKPKITASTSKTNGTTVGFSLDPTVFKDVTLPEELLRNRAIEIAMTNPGLTVNYNDHTYKFKNGLVDVIAQLIGNRQFFSFDINEQNVTGQFFVVLDAHEGLDEQMYTWVNSSLLFDGGKCNTQFFNALFDRTIAELEKEAKKTKTEVTRNDVRRGLLVLANLKIKNPEYDSQAKTRLTGPDLRKEITGVFDHQWKVFVKRASDWLAEVLIRANERDHRQKNKKAQEEHEKTMRKRVPGLLDATSRIRSECRLLITEGESAKSQICEARDPATTGAFALTGKINNVYGATPAQVLKMGKITELLAAIGITPGKRITRNDLNFGQIVVATDADYDGDDIFTNLINLFFQFWPELLDKRYEPCIFRLVAPNVCVIKGNKRLHFARRSEYEKVKEKYKGWEVRYYKGLGSMDKIDWEMVLTNDECQIPIVDDGKMAETMKLLFSDDADARKVWLTT